MASLNYSNYIYLFIDPHNVTIGRKSGASLSLAIGSDLSIVGNPLEGIPLQAPASLFLEENAEQLDFQTFRDLRGTVGDSPDFNTVTGLGAVSPVRIQSPGVDNLEENLNVKKVGTANFFKKTNDFAYDPMSRHRFVISKGKVKFEQLSKTPGKYYVSPTSYVFQTPNTITKDLQNAKNNSRELTGNPDLLLEFKRPEYGDNDKIIKNFGINLFTDFTLKTVDNFKYNQQSYLVIDSFFAPTGQALPYSNLEPRVIDFFTNLYNDIESAPFGGYIMDCSTKIGVPYDYRTVVNEKADEMAAGVVKTGQPKYHPVYNYYDPQYEPAIIETLESGKATERLLPSLYDFLYLPLQNQTLKSFIGLPEENQISLDNINLSNLNTYLDLFSRNFKKYGPDGNLPPLSTAEVIQEYAPPGKVENNSLNNPYDSFLFTEKSIVLNLLNKQVFSFSGGETTLPLSDELVETKNTNIPSWQEDLKSGFYFTENSLQYFNQASEYENAFPFYFKIDLPIEQKGPIAKLLSQNDLLDSFNTHAASLVLPNSEVNDGISTIGNFYGGLVNGYNTNYFNLYNEIKLKTFNLHFLQKPSIPPSDSNEGQQSLAANQPPDYYTADIFLDTIKEISLQAPKNVFIYGQDDLEENVSGIPLLLNELKSQKFFKELKTLFDNNNIFRTPKDLQNGKLAHQETLMYELAKYKITETGGEEFIQSIFLPITDENNLAYYDTQVEPYKEYFYKIFAHKVIVATKYRPTPLPFINPDDSKIQFIYDGEGKPEHSPVITFNYEVEPYFKFVRVPYYNTVNVNISTDEINYSTIEDLPPLPPQVDIVPFREVNNKILILFNVSSGQIKAKHQSIFDSDDAKFIKSYIAQGLDHKRKDSLLTFGSDDQQGVFEIFRVENLPTSYKDLQNDVTLQRQRASTNVPSVLDNILPNVNYYYTFRYVDVHDKLSNPTDFYKVIMVQESGVAPYLKIELINIAEEKFKRQKESISYTKGFKKYIRLKVSGDKSNIVAIPDIEYDDNGFADGDFKTQHVQMSDGPASSADSVFGKKYKMRITSKNTGRKIDINFTVKQPENIINET